MRQSSDMRKLAEGLTFAAITAGVVPGFAAIHKHGWLPETANDAWEDVWNLGGTYTFQDAAVTLGVSSASGNDVDQGTGAWTLIVEGLDGDYDELVEVVTLAGQAKVETEGEFLRVNRCWILTAGSGGTNAGKIYVYDTSDDVVDGVPQTTSKILAIIEAGYGLIQQAIYTVPRTLKAFLMSRYVTFAARTNQFVDVEAMVRPYGGAWLRLPMDSLASGGTPAVYRPYPIPLDDGLGGRSDLKVRAKASAANLSVIIGFELLLLSSAMLGVEEGG